MANTEPPVTPTCRYTHGNLIRAHYRGKVPEWSLIMPGDTRGLGFMLALYVCPTCGYSELFDLDPAQTVKNEQ